MLTNLVSLWNSLHQFDSKFSFRFFSSFVSTCSVWDIFIFYKKEYTWFCTKLLEFLYKKIFFFNSNFKYKFKIEHLRRILWKIVFLSHRKMWFSWKKKVLFVKPYSLLPLYQLSNGYFNRNFLLNSFFYHFSDISADESTLPLGDLKIEASN